MNVKKIIIFFLAAGSICFAGYLAYDLISGNIKREHDTQIFCVEKCKYSQYSYFWEYTGGNATKGFTTENECLNYCTKSRQGFVYRYVVDTYASLISSPPLSDWIKLLNPKNK